MKFKYLTLIVISLSFYTSTFASMRVDPNKVVFADYHGKIYKVTNKDLGQLHELQNLNQFFTPQTNWHHIISNAEPQIAKSLIQKLASYLPKDELWTYIETGLLRKENKFNDLVADTAYKHWEIFATHRELTKIRTNPKYYKNLSVLSNWNSLFAEPTQPIATLKQATEGLVKYSTKVNYHDKRKLRELRTSIALSTDIEQLKILAYHENIHIALSSYYALSKLIPDEMAYEILSQAIFRTEKLEYPYWTGGDVSIGGNGLTLGQAAYDLFSDYLITKYVRKIMYMDPLLKSNIGQRKFILRSKQMFYTLMHRNVYSNSYKQKVDDWNFTRGLQRKEITHFKYAITANNLLERALQKPIMTGKLSQAIIELSYESENFVKLVNDNTAAWIYISFKIHNEHSKNLVEYFLSEKNQKIDIKPIVENLLYQHNWPRDWQDLKQKVNDLAIEYDVSIN